MALFVQMYITNVIMILLQTSVAFQPRTWNKRLSVFPEECSGICAGGTVVDFMLAPGKSCPENINHGKKQDDFIGSVYNICKTSVSI